MKLKYELLSGFALVTILLFVSCQSETKPTVTASSIEPATGTAAPQSLVELTTPSPLSMISAPGGTETASVSILDLTGSPTTLPESPKPLPILTPSTTTITRLTPLPTLDADDLETAIAELLADPMDCDVPCWWGAVPNETTGVEIQQFLSLYQFNFHERYDNQVLDFIEVWVGYDEDRNYVDFRVMYSFDDDMLKVVFAEQSPGLFDILGEYGQPDEVWLETMGFEREEDLPVRLNLVYLQPSMAVGYVVDGDIQNDFVIGCFADEDTGLLQLNTPNSSTNYRDFRGIFEVDRSYLPLEEATNLTIEDFMQQFSDPTQPQCIETPTELWK